MSRAPAPVAAVACAPYDPRISGAAPARDPRAPWRPSPRAAYGDRSPLLRRVINRTDGPKAIAFVFCPKGRRKWMLAEDCTPDGRRTGYACSAD